MKFPSMLLFLLLISLSVFVLEGKTSDPYQVLGVDKTASQRDIQKAFHKLSLKYHPDKNKDKGAQQKFEQINNAYEILSDEEKRKNYDTYGDEKGNPGFHGGNYGDQGGYTYFTNGGPGGYSQNMGGSNSKSYSFSFGKASRDSFSHFGGDFSDLFSQFGGFGGGSTKSQSRSSTGLKNVNSQVFNKEIFDQGITWVLMAYNPAMEGIDSYESVIEEVAAPLQGALKVGSINCKTEHLFCKDLDIYLRKAPKVFIYSYKGSKSGSLIEYTDDLAVRNLNAFCHDHLPKYSERVELNRFDINSEPQERLPRVMLLSTKKNTPVIWRALSGLYRKRFVFYDARVDDVSDPMVKKLGVNSLPAIVGWLSNGEKHILLTGISVKDLKSAVHDLSKLLDGFEKMNKKLASSQSKGSTSESNDKQIPLLTRSNFDALCGESVPVCIIGAFKSNRGRETVESILSMVSQKSLTRRQSTTNGSKDSISYSMLDLTKQPAFLNAFDKSKLKSLDKFLVAYKPRKGKFVTFVGDFTAEEVERFVGSVLNGDVQFSKTRQKPVVQ